MAPLLALALAAAPVAPPPAACPAAPPFAGFEAVTSVIASPSRRDAPLPLLALGRAGWATLAPMETAALEIPRDRPIAPGRYGGMLELRVARAGRYAIGLDSRAWIDVARGRTVVPSVAHGHGPDCGPVRKIVQFDLTPGTYTVQLSDAVKPVAVIMAAPAP